MPLRNFPDAVKEFAIQIYEKPKDVKNLNETHVAYTGTPQKHYSDSQKVILVIDPYSSNISYYEFQSADISFVEELQTIVNADGQTLPIMRLWVKKKAIAVRCIPFVVADTTPGL